MSFREAAEKTADLLEKRSRARAYLDDPVSWAEEYLGLQLWSAQKRMLESVRDNRGTAVAAGHGVGKTYVAAVAAAWWVDVHPHADTFVASTAPSIDQVGLLWDNIRRVHGLAKQRYDEGLVDHPLPGYITGDNKWKLPNGSLIGQGRRPPEQKSDVAFQGRHADYLLAIGDEAVGLSKGFLSALGVIATGQYNRQMLLANPTDPNSAMAKHWTKPAEDSIWNLMHISVYDSPMITHEPGFDLERAKGLSGRDFLVQAAEEYGVELQDNPDDYDLARTDPQFVSRVLGQWAFDAGNTVFTAEDIARGCNTFVLPDTESAPEFGVDIARMGSDSSVIYTAREGDVWVTDPDSGKPLQMTGKRGLQIRRLSSWSKAPLVGNDPANLGSAERVHQQALGEGAYLVKVDASGIGSGVIDGLAMLNDGRYVVVEVFGSAAPADKRAYVNMRAEQYFNLKRRMFAGEIDIDSADETLISELGGIVYEHSERGPIKIESKDSMKKRGKKSPDNADAVWYAAVDVAGVLNPGTQPGDVFREEPDNIIWDEYRSTALYGPGLPA